MTLLSGDLTTPQRVATWMGNGPNVTAPILQQLITSMTALIYNKLNRSRLYSQQFTRTFDGVGTMQIVLPDWPVTSISAVQVGQALIPQSVLVPQGTQQPIGTNSGYGYRYVSWSGNLPGDPAVVEFNGGFFYLGVQNVKITYQAGYAIMNEPQTVARSGTNPNYSYTATVLQPQGIWCRDGGVVYAGTGIALTAVASSPSVGQYIPPPEAEPGLYTFSEADNDASVLISYSFIPADLEEACIQMIAERYQYRSRIGEISKSLGGQESIRYMRGGSGMPWNRSNSLPPEVNDLILPYVSTIPPAIGAPV